MFDRVVVPGDLDEMPPGPSLCAVLAGIDRSRVNGHDLITVLRAQARQVAHEQARLLADMVAVAHCPPGGPDAPVERVEEISEFASAEIGAALCWTRRAADVQLALAFNVVERLPAVGAALSAGLIDLPRARVLSDGVAALSDEDARVVVDAVIGSVPGWTTGRLAARLRTAMLAVDPEAARRRYARGVQQRRLVSEQLADGTAWLAGEGLPVDAAAAARARVEAIARAVKAAGDERTLDQLRADTFCDLLAGRPVSAAALGLPDPTVAAPLAGSTGASTGSEPAHAGAQPGATGSPDLADAAATPATVAVVGGQVPEPRASIELVVPLATLMGLADEPGELGGWGPVLAEIARRVVANHPASTWRYRVVDRAGHLVDVGPVRRRPTAHTAARVVARDRTCRGPGCRVPASRCDLDHIQPYARGGRTVPENLAPLCRYHHRLKHEGGWQFRRTSDGRYIWTSPLGHTYLRGPDALPP